MIPEQCRSLSALVQPHFVVRVCQNFQHSQQRLEHVSARANPESDPRQSWVRPTPSLSSPCALQQPTVCPGAEATTVNVSTSFDCLWEVSYRCFWSIHVSEQFWELLGRKTKTQDYCKPVQNSVICYSIIKAISILIGSAYLYLRNFYF
jgi:hypothetical protein